MERAFLARMCRCEKAPASHLLDSEGCRNGCGAEEVFEASSADCLFTTAIAEAAGFIITAIAEAAGVFRIVIAEAPYRMVCFSNAMLISGCYVYQLLILFCSI